MSSKLVYQTLYGTDHLFRLPTETLADWGQPPAAVTEPAAPAALPVVPPVRSPETPAPGPETVVMNLPTEPLLSAPVLDPTPVASPLPESTTSLASAELLAQPAPPPLRADADRERTLIKHKVLILADEDLSPSDLLFLERILKAVNLDINGVDLLNLYGVSEIDFGAVLRHKYINHFITFGVPFQRINLDIMMDRYHPIRYDGITFLMADSLPVIEASQPLKKLLWNSLKRVFELG